MRLLPGLEAADAFEELPTSRELVPCPLALALPLPLAPAGLMRDRERSLVVLPDMLDLVDVADLTICGLCSLLSLPSLLIRESLWLGLEDEREEAILRIREALAFATEAVRLGFGMNGQKKDDEWFRLGRELPIFADSLFCDQFHYQMGCSARMYGSTMQTINKDVYTDAGYKVVIDHENYMVKCRVS